MPGKRINGVYFLAALPFLIAALEGPDAFEGLFGRSAGVLLIAGILRLALFAAAAFLMLKGLRTTPV